MRLRHVIVSLTLVLAAGCDTMDQDADGQILSINNDPAYLLADTDGIIDLPSRIVSPGKIRVEINGSTTNGILQDLGKGLLKYSPSKGSIKDFFRFRVLNSDNKVIAEDTLRIIVGDTTSVPCGVYTRNDEVRNVKGTVIVDVTANDWSCNYPLAVAISQPPQYGTATMVGNKIQYTPGPSFPGNDVLLYKAAAIGQSWREEYGLLRIFGSGTVPVDTTTTCVSRAVDDLFFKALNDTSLMYLNVTANDTLCSDTTLFLTQEPRFGSAGVDYAKKKIMYKTISNLDDTLFYKIGSDGNSAMVVIKRQ